MARTQGDKFLDCFHERRARSIVGQRQHFSTIDASTSRNRNWQQETARSTMSRNTRRSATSHYQPEVSVTSAANNAMLITHNEIQTDRDNKIDDLNIQKAQFLVENLD